MVIRPDQRASYLFLSERIRPGDIFVDVGACVGDFSRLAADLVGQSGHVYAIEPEQLNLTRLHKNLEGYKNVTIEGCALSSFNGLADLYLGKSPSLHSLKKGLPNRGHEIQVVNVKRLDDFQWVNNGVINSVKIDVEGAELEVLAGGKKTLSDPFVATIAVDVHPSLGVKIDWVKDMIVGFGFQLVTRPGQHNELLGIKGEI